MNGHDDDQGPSWLGAAAALAILALYATVGLLVALVVLVSER